MCDGSLPGLTSFRPRPLFGLAHEQPQLLELPRGRSAGAAKTVDSLEPLEDRLCFLHGSDRTRGPVTDGQRLGQRCVSDRSAKRCPRSEPEELAIEVVHEREPIA